MQTTLTLTEAKQRIRIPPNLVDILSLTSGAWSMWTLTTQRLAREVATRQQQLSFQGRPRTEHTKPSPTSTELRRTGNAVVLLKKSDHQQTAPSGEQPNMDTLEEIEYTVTSLSPLVVVWLGSGRWGAAVHGGGGGPRSGSRGALALKWSKAGHLHSSRVDSVVITGWACLVGAEQNCAASNTTAYNQAFMWEIVYWQSCQRWQ